ncbi:MAG: DUF2721 domain-containing protein [Sphingorhabdus sp.]|nr:DUF2721 domain-containing protein [Sphingorhabdus sp.]
MLNLFTGRLARIIDRSRDLQAQYTDTKGAEHDRIVAELRDLEKRINTVNSAIVLAVLSAIAVSLLIGILFLMELASIDMVSYAAGAFMAAIGLMAASLILFLIEVRFAIRNVRIREVYLELPPTRNSRRPR